MPKKYKYREIIYNMPHEGYFNKQCLALEKYVIGLKKGRLLEDVDGSSYQMYHHEKGDIEVCNDYRYDELYVDSDFDLEPYFAKSKE